MTKDKQTRKLSPAVIVIIMFGFISMLGDMVYESARGANSQYLNLLNISAAQVGIVFGIGEFLGYGLRLLAGIWSDRSRKPWVFMFIGYGMLISVPLMGLSMNWNILLVLMLMERIGKALRNPAKDTVLSAVADDDQVGIGFAFGLQEALDQIGAFAGPLIFTLVFYFTGQHGLGEYQLGYKWLLVPFICLMGFLYYAYHQIQQSQILKPIEAKPFTNDALQPIFWNYTFFTFFCTMGFVNFSTIGYHLKAYHLLADGKITLLYAGAMLIDAIAALLIGKFYDQMKSKTGKKTSGILVLAAIPIITMVLPLLALTHSVPLIIIGMMLFGIIMGSHETIMRSAIADLTPYHKRGTSYGIFNTAYGLALMAGSSLMGLLYDQENIGGIMVLTVISEIIALFLFQDIKRSISQSEN